MVFHTLAFALQVAALALMLTALALRISKIMHTDCTILSVAFGFVLLSCSAIVTRQITAAGLLFTLFVGNTMIFHGVRHDLRPARAYHRMRGRS